MLLKVLAVFFGIVLGIGANCPPCRDAPKHYEELNCTGARNPGDCCDTRYICADSMYEKHPDRCQYHGNLYDYGTIVDHSLLPPCINEAKCVASSDGPKFEFVHQEPVPVEAGCLPQYTFDSMCNPSQKVCDPVEKKKLAKCHLRGKEYYEGQLFTPTFSSFFSSACYQCICDASFENDTAPAFNKNCRKFKCAIELFNAEKLKNGCVPVYETKDIYDAEPTCCCPIDFVCPESNHRETYRPGPGTNPMSCVFGDRVIGFGDAFETGQRCRTCTCTTPPALTCIQTDAC